MVECRDGVSDTLVYVTYGLLGEFGFCGGSKESGSPLKGTGNWGSDWISVVVDAALTSSHPSHSDCKLAGGLLCVEAEQRRRSCTLETRLRSLLILMCNNLVKTQLIIRMCPKDPAESSNSSTSSSDAEEIEIEALEAEVSELTRQLEENPYLYDAQERRITLLRKAGELDRLREAREMMSKYFPLTPKMWLQWTEDEASLLTEGDDRGPIYQLFKRALADYQSVDVWLEYCQFSIGGIGSGESTELDSTRAVLEEAVANQGLNFARGAVLFEVYREFETVCLAQLQAKNDPVAIANQVKKIDTLFQRQLSIPHMDQTMEEYKTFLEEISEITDIGLSDDCKVAFESAKAKWRAVENYEAAVADSADENALLSAWQSYLSWVVENASRKGTRANFVKKSAAADAEVAFTPMEVICLFERALTDLCLHVSIWLQMAGYLEAHVSADRQRLITTLARAVRNISWSSDLWCRYALACEARAWDLATTANSSCGTDDASAEHPVSHLSGDFDPVRDIYENALKCAFPSASDLIAVWLAYCDFLLRVLRNSKDSNLKERCIKMLRDTFERAQNHTSAAFPAQCDQDCPIYRYWAFVEAKFLGDKECCRELWKAMLKMGSNGNKPAFWIAYLDFVKNYDEADQLVRVAGMAVNSVTGDYTETVFQTVRRCLAESGLELKRLREFDAKVAQRRVRLASLGVPKKAHQGDGADHVPSRQRSNRPDTSSEAVSRTGKRKLDDNASPSTAAAAKRQKADVEEAPEKSGRETENASRPKHGETVIHDPSKDDQTVFVSNLPFSTTEEELRSIFIKCGELASIRLVRDYAGKSKGFGYVEFADASSVPAALELDRLPIGSGGGDAPGRTVTGGIGGRPMFVSVCDTNRSKSSFAYKTGMPEPNKLFVRNLDKVTTEEALQTFFSKHGRVTSVRIVTFRNGMPKGHAYVEFATEEEASRALVATDGVVFGSKAISVAISNPPPRSAAPTARSTHGQAKQKAPSLNLPVRSKAHTQLSFMPRALHRPAAGAPTPQPSLPSEATSAESGGVTAPKSNMDFRKMFLNQ
ncbi:Squamou cell carcinoma antigen recognized by T-cell 3 [Taenia crassiceps]|uniref:Squamou cell carcinoma antigen recognized by T-cell 3 n=1 Tax=Taenia crassiceps TaxID=6207 RepID=A0ABR4Q0A2_9CEST